MLVLLLKLYGDNLKLNVIFSFVGIFVYIVYFLSFVVSPSLLWLYCYEIKINIRAHIINIYELLVLLHYVVWYGDILKFQLSWFVLICINEL